MRKKSCRLAATSFEENIGEIQDFVGHIADSGCSERWVTWAYDYALIRAYREFEDLVLSCLIAAINRDTTEISEHTGVPFPKHMNDEVCEYLVVGNGYFDFRGRADLIKKLKQFLPDNHYLVDIIRKDKYRTTLEQLSALRNFAAHDSPQSKRAALAAIDGERLSSAGAWMKRQARFDAFSERLCELSREVAERSPF